MSTCNRKAKFGKVLGLLAAIASIGILAGCHRHSPEEKIQYVSEKIASKLDFNDQQKSLFEDITKELKVDFAEEKKIRLSLKSEVQGMIQSDQLDKVRVKSLIKERQDRMNSKIDKYLDKVAALHKTLTADQKKEIIEKMDKFSEKME